MSAAIKAESDGISADLPDSAMQVDNAVTKTSAPQPGFSFLTNAPAASKLGLPSSLDPNVKMTSSSNQPVKSATTYALSQLPALRKSLAQLKPEIQGLKDLVRNLEGQAQQQQGQGQGQGYVGNGNEDESVMMSKKPSAADERAIYIETQARLHLERRGVDVDGGSSGRADEDNMGMGRKRIPPEEVHSLERIAATLGGTDEAGEGHNG